MGLNQRPCHSFQTWMNLPIIIEPIIRLYIESLNRKLVFVCVRNRHDTTKPHPPTPRRGRACKSHTHTQANFIICTQSCTSKLTSLNSTVTMFLTGQSFWSFKIPHDWGWRKILKLRDLFRPHLKLLVGNGTNIFIWHVNWHPKGPLLLKFGHSVIYD